MSNVEGRIQRGGRGMKDAFPESLHVKGRWEKVQGHIDEMTNAFGKNGDGKKRGCGCSYDLMSM
jgi:hypothetical protein